MTKEKLWDAYVTKNPSFNREGCVTMTAYGLKKLFEQTWEMAEEKGRSDAMAIKDRTTQKTPMAGADIFGGIFH